MQQSSPAAGSQQSLKEGLSCALLVGILLGHEREVGLEDLEAARVLNRAPVPLLIVGFELLEERFGRARQRAERRDQGHERHGGGQVLRFFSQRQEPTFTVDYMNRPGAGHTRTVNPQYPQTDRRAALPIAPRQTGAHLRHPVRRVHLQIFHFLLRCSLCCALLVHLPGCSSLSQRIS